VEQRKIMNYIEVWPIVCEYIAIFWGENVHTIEGNLQSMSFK
jgi:hypothetical protein